MTPDGLTAIGFFGAMVTFGGYALSAWNPLWLFLASLGFLINWLGDSLDGTLARYREIERWRYGYVLDNSLDVASQFLVTVGIGMSGFIRWDLCFLALNVLLMMSSLTFIRVGASGIHHLAYGRIGLTELRMAGIGLNAVIFFFPPARLASLGLPMSYPNMLSLFWSCCTLVVFAVSLVAQIREMAAEDPPRKP